jgi:hypothetical protein
MLLERRSLVAPLGAPLNATLNRALAFRTVQASVQPRRACLLPRHQLNYQVNQ